MIPIISRAQWDARAPRSGGAHVGMQRRTGFMIHHSGGPADQSVRAIQDHCMDTRGFRDIDYNFLVNQHGSIYMGRGWGVVGSHCVGQNTTTIGVCVIGTNELSRPARAALRQLYATAVSKAGHYLYPLVHRDKWATACPGNLITAWVHDGWLHPRTLRHTVPLMSGHDVRAVQRLVGAEPDGDYGPLTVQAVQRWQHAHGLADDGVVGPLTMAAMGF